MFCSILLNKNIAFLPTLATANKETPLEKSSKESRLLLHGVLSVESVQNTSRKGVIPRGEEKLVEKERRYT